MGLLKEIGEFGLIEKIASSFSVPDGYLGIGDDCAVLPQENGRQTLVSTDMLVEGTHFLLSDISPFDLGWKSAAVNFSDIAASGGRPVGSFLSIALPPTLSEEWVDSFLAGYRRMSDLAGAAAGVAGADGNGAAAGVAAGAAAGAAATPLQVGSAAGVPLLGGDTTSSPDRLCINVTVIGEAACGLSRLRSAARPGDLVCVTGTLGDSAAGLRQILEGRPRSNYLIQRHYRPQPRIAEGLVLASCEGVHAMMDISDGVASDLRHILKASGVGARIDVTALPLSPALLETCAASGWDPVRLALCGGEDYELLFTLAPSALASLSSLLPTGGATGFTVIGEITATPGLVWQNSAEDYFGYTHF